MSICQITVIKAEVRKLPESREHRVAIAVTEDERHVASHFGAAPRFLVLRVKKGRVIAREVRTNTDKCIHASGTLGCWDVMERVLPDVRVVISSGMGENAYVGLLRRDVLPLVTDETAVEEAIRSYLHDRLYENPSLVHPPPNKAH
jgi:predicted Fe-Mo cluster-binding NifX family protein